jgi:hypothetical protein
MNITDFVQLHFKKFPQYRWVIERIAAAYSDCVEGLEAERNLDFFSHYPVNGAAAKAIVRHCIGGYNNLTPETFDLVLHFFEAEYFFAREGSFCVYVRPEKCVCVESLSMLKKEAKIDELTFDSNLQMFRLWWD